MILVYLRFIPAYNYQIDLFHDIILVISAMFVIRPELVEEFLLLWEFLVGEFDVLLDVGVVLWLGECGLGLESEGLGEHGEVALNEVFGEILIVIVYFFDCFDHTLYSYLIVV